MRDIRVVHPDPFAKVGKLTFLREVDQLQASLASLSEQQRVVGAMRVIASIGDGHTQLEPDNPAFALWYPFRLYLFSDGLFIVSAHQSQAELVGAKVLAIGGKRPEEAIADAQSLMGADNASGAAERIYALHNAGLMQGLGYASPAGELKVRVKLVSGRIVDRTIKPLRTDNKNYKPDDATFEWQFRSEVFGPPVGPDSEWVSAFRSLHATALAVSDTLRPIFMIGRAPYLARALSSGNSFYVRVNQLDDGFIPFLQSGLKEVDRMRPQKLIIDVRQNYGGDGSVIPAMIRELTRRSADQPWQEMYVLIGRRTFSAAIMMVDALAEHFPLTIVGEPSGAAYNHFGDATIRTYPRTGLRLHVSTLWHQLSSSDDRRESIPVDVPAQFTSADYAAGRDPAVDPIVAGEEMRSIPMIALAKGGGEARRIYLERKQRFGNYPWFAVPTELALRDACQALFKGGRAVDAIDTCRLNSELHPWMWSSWFNLGSVQRGAALGTERLGSYRCALIVDPNGPEADTFRDFLAKRDPKSEVPPATGCPVH